jgi:nitroreductase
MDVIEIIKNRTSCRTFDEVPLALSDKKELENYLYECSSLDEKNRADLRIVVKKNPERELKLDYGMIRGHHTYLLGTSETSQESRVNYGYLMEKVVLKATEMGIATCWVGYFDETFFDEIHVNPGREIPGLVLLGYPASKQSGFEKFLRFSTRASKRQGWERQFYYFKNRLPLEVDLMEPYFEPLEMVRWAPSSGNTQPWRIFFDENANRFHFYKKVVSKKYEDKGLHDLDMGIALAHFELTSAQNQLPGSWARLTNGEVNPIDDLQYIITWNIL